MQSLILFYRMPRFSKLFMARHRISQVFNLNYFVKLCYSSLNSAGKGLANPTALLLSSLMMLRSVHAVLFNISTQLIMPIRHMKLYDHANRIERAALTVSFYDPLRSRNLTTYFSYRRLLKERQLPETWEARPVPSSILPPL